MKSVLGTETKRRMWEGFSYQTFVPHLHKGQSQEIIKKLIYLHEGLHEGSTKVKVQSYALFMSEMKNDTEIRVWWKNQIENAS